MSNKSVSEAIGDKLKMQVLKLMEEKPASEKKPSNIGLVLAWIGFNAIYFFLDLGTSVMVGTLTNVFYGIMTFPAGIFPFLLNEVLFTRAYNSKFQKWLSVFGAVVSIASTVILALIVGAINAIKFFQITVLPDWVSFGLEITLVIGLVSAVGIHGLVWILYFFGDNGITTVQKHVQDRAERENKKKNLAMAKEDVQEYIELAKEIDQYSTANQLEILSNRYEKLTGQKLVIETAPMNGNGNTPNSSGGKQP